jgi:hypothetical protein
MAIPLKDELLAPYADNWNTRIATGYATFALTSAQATAFAAVYQPYADAWAALQAARAAGIRSESLTTAKQTAKENLLPLFRELYAFVQNSLSVTAANKDLLGVTVKSSERTPTAPPGAVSNFTAAIEGNGALTIRWKSDNPAGVGGTMYMVWRKIGTGGFTFCGGTGQKEYTDATVPAGTTSICYQIQAVRSTGTGPWAQYNVNFSTEGEASVTQGQAVKIAA